MSEYRPDRWVVVKITAPNSPPIHKFFACWFGGWAGADSWKMNSGISNVTLEGNVYSFEGWSGSVYECHKDVYGTNMYGKGILEDFIKRMQDKQIIMEVLPEKTNWLEIKYE